MERKRTIRIVELEKESAPSQQKRGNTDEVMDLVSKPEYDEHSPEVLSARRGFEGDGPVIGTMEVNGEQVEIRQPFESY